MTNKSLSLAALFAAMIGFANGPADAAPCGNNSAGFEGWKRVFAGEASGNGLGPKAIAALMATKYSVGTIRADRGQKSFKLSLDQFMAKRGGPAIAARGKGMKSANAGLFASIEKRFGVPAGPIIAIWGMETAFGNFMGNQPTISAVATLAYDCRRPEYFTDQLFAALQLVDRGVERRDARPCMARSARPSSAGVCFISMAPMRHQPQHQGRCAGSPQISSSTAGSGARVASRDNRTARSRLERGRRLSASHRHHRQTHRRELAEA
jgi:membrane-bound lytic murein transglycosylase B